MLIYNCSKGTEKQNKRKEDKKMTYHVVLLVGSYWDSIRTYKTESACRRYISWSIRKGRHTSEELQIMDNETYFAYCQAIIKKS